MSVVIEFSRCIGTYSSAKFELIIKPFNLSKLLECKIVKQVNHHFELYFSGYVAEDEDESLQMLDITEITVEIEQEGERLLLFKGLLSSVSTCVIGKLVRLDVKACSYTCLLDYKKFFRFFQEEGQTYKSVINKVTGMDGRVGIIYAPETRQILCDIAVQYEETTWEFLVRMASHLQTVIVPDCTNSFPCFFFGVIPKKMVKIEEDIFYQKTSMVEQGIEVEEYWFEDKNVWPLCTMIEYRGRSYLVHDIETRIERGEVIHRYGMRVQDGFRTKKNKNMVIAGTSVMGKVFQVKNDQVRIRVSCDHDFHGESSRWFPYSTVYSSPEGTGWYCMPEKGDTVRLYFPDAEESNAYVISAVHLGAVNDMRQKPDEKSIRTIYDKEIRLTSSKIILTNHKGLSVILDDKKGISIISKKMISLTAKGGIRLSSKGSLHLESGNSVMFKQGDNLLMLRNGIRQYGLDVKLH